MNELIKTTPVLLEKVWGDDKLGLIKGHPGLKIGESWEISTMPGAPSIPPGMIAGDELSYLVKLISTLEPLSVQVHPDDETALRLEKSGRGKTECWLILESAPGAGIWLGLSPKATREALETAIQNKTDLSACLNFFETQRGDFFIVPAGAVHAIGKGNMLLEIQPASDITYRLWDWNRQVDGCAREIHVEKAIESVQFSRAFNDREHFCLHKKVFDVAELNLFTHADFEARFVTIGKGQERIFDLRKEGRPAGIVLLSGEANFLRGGQSVILKEFESLLCPLQGADKLQVKASETSSIIFIV
jgi:mannose-6-phosphate isomerase